MQQEVKIDNSGFNVPHYADKTKQQFIDDQLASVPDSYGSEANKLAFLKTAWVEMSKHYEKKAAKK